MKTWEYNNEKDARVKVADIVNNDGIPPTLIYDIIGDIWKVYEID